MALWAPLMQLSLVSAVAAYKNVDYTAIRLADYIILYWDYWQMYQKQQRTDNTVSWIEINTRLCIGSSWGGFIWGNAAFFSGWAVSWDKLGYCWIKKCLESWDKKMFRELLLKPVCMFVKQDLQWQTENCRYCVCMQHSLRIAVPYWEFSRGIMLGKAFFKNLFYKDSALLINVSRYVLTKKNRERLLVKSLHKTKCYLTH